MVKSVSVAIRHFNISLASLQYAGHIMPALDRAEQILSSLFFVTLRLELVSDLTGQLSYQT
jgi:hypothetical protein